MSLFNSASHERKFSELSQHEDCENLIESSSEDGTLVESKSKPFSRAFKPLLFIFTSLGSLIVGLLIGRSYTSTIPDGLCVKESTKYSPLLEDVNLNYKWVQFNGSFMHETIFRKDASPEVDSAWESLGPDYRAIIVPQSLGTKSGLTENHIQVNPKHGGGFPANVEGLHHLHCLNLLRQSLFYNYDYYQKRGQGAFVNDEGILKYHVTHCLDALRQKLMCTPSIDVLGQVWYDVGGLNVFPDFNTRHKCLNFESIREWAKEHQAPAKVPEDYLAPPTPGSVFDGVP